METSGKREEIRPIRIRPSEIIYNAAVSSIRNLMQAVSKATLHQGRDTDILRPKDL